MVLMDDNFATIVAAVKEGRAIYDNIRKFIKYLMATNVGELTVMLLAPLFGMPLPLLPLQILWMNLVTDGLPGLALGFEPPEPNVMDRRPNRPNESIFARGLGTHIMWAGPLMGIIALVTGWALLAGRRRSVADHAVHRPHSLPDGTRARHPSGAGVAVPHGTALQPPALRRGRCSPRCFSSPCCTYPSCRTSSARRTWT